MKLNEQGVSLGTERSRIMVVGVICIIILACIIYFASERRRTYISEVKKGISAYEEKNTGLLTEEDIKDLPEAVQKYIGYTGALGRSKAWDVRAELEGRMRTDTANESWMKFTAEQYNFFSDPTRMFYIKGSMSGIPVYGLHSYKNETGSMLVKVLGLVTVVDGKGKEMDEGDCVTLFNDMCLFAPSALTDKRITWEKIDDLNVKAVFHNGSIKVSALLYFNEAGELINFVSDDRYMSATGRTYEKLRWSTPVKAYHDFNGRRLAADIDVVWTMPDGSPYKYMEAQLKSVEYNCSVFK